MVPHKLTAKFQFPEKIMQPCNVSKVQPLKNDVLYLCRPFWANMIKQASYRGYEVTKVTKCPLPKKIPSYKGYEVSKATKCPLPKKKNNNDFHY